MSKMTGVQLVEFCRSKIGTDYVYGMKGTVMTEANFNYLQKKYPKYVPNSDRKNIGKVCVDCSGLIGWACGIHTNAAGWHEKAKKEKNVYSIGSISKAPVGALVWRTGHIGVYSGMKNGKPHYVAADGSKHDTREAPLSANDFTHWMLVESVFSYKKGDEEMVEKGTIIVNGKKCQVDMIRKDGVTFVKTRDFAEVFGLEVSNSGKIPVLNTKN